MTNEWENRKRMRAGKKPVNPLYTYQDAIDCLKLFKPVNYSEEIKINELIPFEWDFVYTFYPYMTIGEIEDIIGFRSNKIFMAESENIQQLLFVKDDKVVCNIFGSPSKLNFHFDLGEFENRYVKIRKTDQHSFSIEVRDEIKYFSIIK